MAMRSSGRERVDSQIMRAKAVDLETTVRRRRVRRGEVEGSAMRVGVGYKEG
jgi:hypothetical protein